MREERATDMTQSPGIPRVRFAPTTLKSLRVEQGFLRVPMNRSTGAGRVDLTFLRLPAKKGASGDPIVFLTGGPGISAMKQGEGRLFELFDRLRRIGEVILLDQRGCGNSGPLGSALESLVLPDDRPLTREQVLQILAHGAREKAERLRARGVDLSAFNTNDSADDVADLVRTVYGAETRVALLGRSYGTHLAMAVMRRHESLASRAVLAGPEGPDHTYKLPSRIQQHVEEIARRARAGTASTPDLVATMKRVFECVEKEPQRVVITDHFATLDVTIGRFDLEWMVAEGLADTRFLRRLPFLFDRLDAGDFSALANDEVASSLLIALRSERTHAMVRYCMDCASGATAARRERIEREARETLLGRTIEFPFPEICEAIGSPDLGDDFRTPQRCDVPVLFITGTLDCRTPAENVADLAGFYPNHRHLVVEDVGHGDLLLPGAVQRNIERFFRDGSIDAERVSADTPFAFEMPRPVLLYDGDCSFCRGQVERLKRRTGDAVEFAPFQHVAARYPELSREALRREVHLVDEQGRVMRGAEAVLTARTAGGRPDSWLWMYRHVPGFSVAAEWMYRLVARHRGRLPGAPPNR